MSYINQLDSNEGLISKTARILKIVAKIVIITGCTLGIILGIVMFSKASDSSNNFLTGDVESEIYSWLGAIFLFGLSSLSIVHFFILTGVAKTVDLLEREKFTDQSMADVTENREKKAYVLFNEYGMYCSNCKNYIEFGEYKCRRCKSVLIYGQNNKDDNPDDYDLTYNLDKQDKRFAETYENKGHQGSVSGIRPSFDLDDKPVVQQKEDKKEVIKERIPEPEKSRYTQYVNKDDGIYVKLRFCHSCGYELREESRFCPSCGIKV